MSVQFSSSKLLISENALATNFASFFPMLSFAAIVLAVFMMYLQTSLGSRGRTIITQQKKQEQEAI